MRFILFVGLFLSTVAHAIPGAITGTCHEFNYGFTGTYCVYKDPSSTNKDTVYHFHGRFGDALQYGTADSYHAQVREEWKAMGVEAPTVVSVSLGPVWLLAEKNASTASGTFEVLRDQILPNIETEIGVTEGRRIVLGESMGGFNGLQMALKTDYFTKAAILCAPLPFGVTPFSTPEEVEAMIKESTAYAYYGEKKRDEIDGRVSEMIALAKFIFQTPENWAKADSLTLAANLDKAKPPVDFYLAAGFYDPFVLYEGNAELAKRLRVQGLNVDWRPQWGGHCAIDIPSLARFLVQ